MVKRLRRIMVVDDNPEMARTIAEGLGDREYEASKDGEKHSERGDHGMSLDQSDWSGKQLVRLKSSGRVG